MVGINLNFLEKNKINMTVYHKKDFLWYEDKFRRQNENINLSLIIHNLPKEKLFWLTQSSIFLNKIWTMFCNTYK
ncbi:hypothetical protein JPM2_6680 [Mycoplasmopsis felis]|uniref:Uncharacterized protein n=1 Tax=Mycoplasmopsis felis TaxID=33923 RepID=A0A809RSQ6_9BACT|nr:hypothetical protein JPM2_6680 [Mycoplasmopsis felis]